MEDSDLDDYCWGILLGLIMKGESSSFNELYRWLNRNDFKITYPTLSNHLKHLEKAGYVKREKKEDSQFVFYSVISNKLKIQAGWNRLRNIASNLEYSEKKFFSLPESEQVMTVLVVLWKIELNRIKAEIGLSIDKNIENRFTVMFWNSSFLKASWYWLVKKCVEDEKYRKKILREIDKWLEKL